MEHLIGFDIGGTKCAAVLGRTEGGGIRILEKAVFPTGECAGPEPALERLARLAEELIARRGLQGRISAAGISCGGPLDSGRGLILSPPNLPGWDDVPAAAILGERLGLPVRLQNDANACALAEWRFGAGVGCRNLIFLTFGTGIGAGLILDGRLYRGTGDFAGEIGHIRLSEHGPVGYGKEGSFEGFCSGGGIRQIARAKVLERLQRGEPVSLCKSAAELDALDARRVADAAGAGDPLAREIYAVSGRCLGRGLAMLIDLLNPERIVIGSIFARSRELLWPSALEVIRSEALPGAAAACSVVPAALGERLGDVAALSAALPAAPCAG